MKVKCMAVAALLSLTTALTSQASIIEPGFNSSTLAPNDDESTGAVNIGFDVNFFGLTFSQLFVNNNGNVTFDNALSAYTPFDLTSTGRQIIAPFFADVDTRFAGDPVTYGTGSFGGMLAFGVNWLNVDYYASSAAHTNRNSFQLILVDRSDIAAGDFDIIFNYDQIQWETGTASSSGGDANGLGGNSARVGYSNGTGNAGSFFELAGSAVNGALLDGGSNALVSNRLNSRSDGRYIFNARNGAIDTPPTSVPEAHTFAIFGLGLILITAMRRRQQR
ncbi:nidogen-like domain-containing protein [Arsukibacterium sp.]|uniref:nidogen-like domain-containing protein n=1 Tax=Arsukibacterium sp. TaxID=1977258 RepID=UPI00299D19A3|nr:nidogen-like domain-containing protein [Arsukibacterium sp.]MDX1676686.1 nidogen-like domain-containing protein [Arsukibacterium sp.]